MNNELNEFNESEFFTRISSSSPDWLITTLDEYSKDLKILEANWDKICEQLKTTRKKIILVSYLPETEEQFNQQPELRDICDILTRNGYIVRKADQLQGCEGCNKAILTLHVYNYLKNRYKWSRDDWSKECSECKR